MKEMHGRNVSRAAFWARSCICFLIVFAAALVSDLTMAQGEIILYPGEAFLIPELAGRDGGADVEVIVDNPDIVGMDETGKCAVGIAAGTTEVTVRGSFGAYTYVFSVRERYTDYNSAGDDTGTDLEEGMYFGEALEEPVDGSDDGAGRGDESERDHSTGGALDNADEQSATREDGSTPSPTVPVSSPEKNPAKENEPRTHYKEETGDIPASDDNGFVKGEIPGGIVGSADLSGMGKGRPLTFRRGISGEGGSISDGRILWIEPVSSGRVIILYVGADGIPVPYSLRGKRICIREEDLRADAECIQVLAADESGKIRAMADFKPGFGRK